MERGSYQKCVVCKDYHYSKFPCNPEYLVFHEDYLGEEGKVFYASSFEDAALRYGRYYNDSGDYALMNEEINVQVGKDGELKWFCVGAEPDVHYSAAEVDEPENEEK